jgi:hypothetical protein
MPDPTPGKWPQGLTQDLKCLVCHELLSKPVSLWCGHSFCQDCLNKWMISKQSCPSCRQIIPTGKCIQVNQAISAFLLHMNGSTEEDPRRHEPNEDEKVDVKDGISQHSGLGEERNSDGPGERKAIAFLKPDLISIDEDEKDGDRIRVKSNAECEICKQVGEMIVCDGGDRHPGCASVYHIHCIDLNVFPKGKSMAAI